jgi:hypothetical protein
MVGRKSEWSSVHTGLIIEAHVVITDLRNGFDSGKGDEFFPIINSIINEKRAVDVTASALSPLPTVKGLHAHSDFNTARIDDAGQSANSMVAQLASFASQHHLLQVTTE